jgi:beta-glucosidase
MNKSVLKFPQGFLWGAATAAHQVEGNNIHNDWWEFEQKGNVKGGETSGIAVDHYNRYEEDFDIAKSLNHNVHRFSIEWSRIEPSEGEFDKDEIRHYAEVIKALKARGMKVMVTLFHYTSPLWFAKKGGWENRNALRDFLRFVEYILRYLGQEIDYWITFNEPVGYAVTGYLRGEYPPGIKSPLRFLKVLNILACAHNETYFLIHRYFRDAVVGIAKNIPLIEPLDKKSSKDRFVTWIAKYVDSKLFLGKVIGMLDFLGVQNYHYVRVKFRLGGEYVMLGDEYGVNHHIDNKYPRCDRGWEINPEGLYYVLKDLKKYNLPIIITENGVADREDKLRADFIRDHLISVYKAIQERVNVQGYIHWTLMDNFEWKLGRSARYGLVEIDYENNLRRIIRPSAKYFAKICKENVITVNRSP